MKMESHDIVFALLIIPAYCYCAYDSYHAKAGVKMAIKQIVYYNDYSMLNQLSNSEQSLNQPDCLEMHQFLNEEIEKKIQVFYARYQRSSLTFEDWQFKKYEMGVRRDLIKKQLQTFCLNGESACSKNKVSY